MVTKITKKGLARHVNGLVYVNRHGAMTLGCLGQTSGGSFFVNPVDCVEGSAFLSDNRTYLNNRETVYFPVGSSDSCRAYRVLL